MVKLSEISAGDRVSFDTGLRHYGHITRTVHDVAPTWVSVYLRKKLFLLPVEKITSHVKTGNIRNLVSSEMFRLRITNEQVAEKSGYSVGTIDRIRRGLRVKPRTLADIMDTISNWK